MTEFNLTKQISKFTICNRIRRHKHDPKHHGPKSPLEEVEEALVVIYIQMGKIHKPLTVKEGEGVQLLNALIGGTPIQGKIITFHNKIQNGNDAFDSCYIGKGWWRGFMRSNGHRIVT